MRKSIDISICDGDVQSSAILWDVEIVIIIVKFVIMLNNTFFVYLLFRRFIHRKNYIPER